jgi:sterol desaturase/sphingolipid hydroxylase (fatty acid hydroxylase superfamily)
MTAMDPSAVASVRTLLIVAAGVAVAAAMLEGVVTTLRRRDYDWRAAFASLAVAVGRRVLDLVPLSIAMPGAYWLYEQRLWTVPLDAWWGWVLLMLGLEFCYYWFHRTAHRVRWFWASHAVHHSPNQLNLSAAYRLSWTGRISGTLLFFVPLAWLGFPPAAIAAAFALNLLYQFWIHAAWIPRLGPLEGILNTPSAHRVHHAANPEYLDANYGGVLLVFDRLFGTYVPERDSVGCRYGLVQPLLTNNPLRIAFFQWVALIRDLRRARGPRDVAGYLLGPPGWAPDGAGDTTAALRARAAQAAGAVPQDQTPPAATPVRSGNRVSIA